MAKESEDAQLEKIERLRREALAKELEKIRNKTPIKQKTKNIIEASLRDRAVAEQESFQAKGAKTAGITAGYIATEKTTGETFILKQFFKDKNDCQTAQDVQNRNDGVQEFIGATIYQFLLYDRAPKEQLVVPDQDNPRSLYVRSKFFKDVKPLSGFLKTKPGTNIIPNSSKLKNLEGFEKVVAACHILGESDYHAGNMMVTKDGIVTKIDHGRSFWHFHKDFSSMIESTDRSFKNLGYAKIIQNGMLAFDVEKYSASLNQMLSQLSEEQIDKIIDQRVDELSKAGFNPEGLTAKPRFSSEGVGREHPINNFDDLRTVYKEITKENLRNMQEIAKQVEIVAKFSNVAPEFKKGGWVKALAESSEKDPIQYAIKHNIKIDGIDAKQYVIAQTIDRYLREKDPVKKLELEEQYKSAVKELEIDKSYDKSTKTAKQYVLEGIIEQYLKTDDPVAQKTLKEKYAAAQKIGEEQAPKLLTMESSLGQFLNNPKTPEILANHKDFKGKSTLATDIDYTKCDLDVIKKCKEVHEKTSKARDYDTLSTVQKVGLAFATVVPIIGNAIAYYAMKSHNKSEKAKLEATIGQSLEGVKSDLDSLSKKPKQSKGSELGLSQELGQIRQSVSAYKSESRSSTVVGRKREGSIGTVER